MVGRDFKIGARDLLPSAIHDAVETDVVFERVGAGDVVVVSVGEPHRDASRLIDLAGDRLEVNRHIHILRRERQIHSERKAIGRSVLARLRDRLLPSGGRVRDDFPSADRTATGQRKLETRRRDSNGRIGDLDLDGLLLGLCSSGHGNTSDDQDDERESRSLHGVARPAR